MPFDLPRVFAPKEVQAERSAICASCPENNGEYLPLCRQCGCPIYPKVTIAFIDCPLGKWAQMPGREEY